MTRKTIIALLFVVAWVATAFAERTAGESVDDSTLAAKVKTALVDAENVPGTSINIEVYKGNVLLAAFVESEAAKSSLSRP